MSPNGGFAIRTVSGAFPGAGAAFDEGQVRATATWIATDVVNIVQEHENADPLVGCLMEAGDYTRSNRQIMEKLRALPPGGYAEFAYTVYLPDMARLAPADLYFGAPDAERQSWLRRQILAQPREDYKAYEMVCILDKDEISWYTIELDSLVDVLHIELEGYFSTTTSGARPQALMSPDGREFIF